MVQMLRYKDIRQIQRILFMRKTVAYLLVLRYGKLEPDNATSGWGYHCVDVSVDECEKDCLKKEIAKDESNPPNYNLLYFNCHHWVSNIFGRCGVQR